MSAAVDPVTLQFHGLGRDDEEVQPTEDLTFEDLLRQREIHPETVLVFCNDEVVPVEDRVPAGARVRVVHIVSGG